MTVKELIEEAKRLDEQQQAKDATVRWESWRECGRVAPVLAAKLEEAVGQIRYLVNCECGHADTGGICASRGDAEEWLDKEGMR